MFPKPKFGLFGLLFVTNQTAHDERNRMAFAPSKSVLVVSKIPRREGGGRIGPSSLPVHNNIGLTRALEGEILLLIFFANSSKTSVCSAAKFSKPAHKLAIHLVCKF